MVSSIGAMFGAAPVETFLGLPTCANPADLVASVAVLGVQGATPYRSVGAYCAGGPAAIRAAAADYAASLGHVDFDFGEPLLPDAAAAADLGDLPFDPSDHAANRSRIEDTITAVLERRAVPIVIGGDDSIAIPVIAAYRTHGPLTVLQIDAHIDWRDQVDGERWGLSSTMRRAAEMPHVDGMVQVGARAIGSARPRDLEDATRWGSRIIPARQLHRDGIGAVLAEVPEGGSVFVNFDCDGLDPAIMPGVIGRAPGGLSYWQAVELLHGVAAKATLAGMAVVEYMPERDVDGMGALTAARIVAHGIGLAARQGGALPSTQ